MAQISQYLLLLLVVQTQAYHFWCPRGHGYPALPVINCSSYPPAGSSPKDVRKLHPADIDLVMALGDSITAGFAMKDGPVEYRGTVYSTGGDDGARTIGNFLAHYNPTVLGRAKGTTLPLTTAGKGLNFAVSGAVARDVPGQITRLTAKLATDEYKEYRDDWKLLTLWIGANDICDCRSTTPESFEKYLTESLEQIKRDIPKTFVNVMTIFNIRQVWDNSRDALYCEIAVPILHECDCLTKDADLRREMDELALKINKVTEDVVAKFAAQNDTTFHAVVQPAVQHLAINTFPRNITLDFLSGLDCFHPSLCADEGIAIALWNNMFAPAGKKKTTIDPLNPPEIHCPTEKSVLM